MAECPYCNTPLAGSERVCKDCYDKGYSTLDRPKPTFLERFQSVALNPTGLAYEKYAAIEKPSNLVAIGCVALGVVFCWIGAFAFSRIDYTSMLLGKQVIVGALWCLSLSVGFVALMVRNRFHFLWKLLPLAFLFSSFGVASIFYIASRVSLNLYLYGCVVLFLALFAARLFARR